MARTVLKINSSARRTGSNTRKMVDRIVERTAGHEEDQIIERDVTAGLPFITEDWISAAYTSKENRSQTDRTALAVSDALIEELRVADVVVIGVPMYNFGVPAGLKAWIDQVARAGETFKYTDAGPVGLLENKKAYVVVASGGTKSGSEIDFTTGYIKHVLSFIGIKNVELIVADRVMSNPEAVLSSAESVIDAIAA